MHAGPSPGVVLVAIVCRAVFAVQELPVASYRPLYGSTLLLLQLPELAVLDLDRSKVGLYVRDILLGDSGFSELAKFQQQCDSI